MKLRILSEIDEIISLYEDGTYTAEQAMEQITETMRDAQ